ncbi:MAG: amino acid ABC transporter ATP-binding protein [Lachnospiraceae bacterium]|nr:amino acid ABC transporter ATP-binding protein [Lachnospiraceae bacterium]
MIELRSLRKEFAGETPLENVNAVINDGDIISVIGPSGVGKSTLLRCINMLEKPTSGQILVNGEDITVPGYDLKKIRRKMGMVFQSFNLFGHLSVIENIMLPQIDLLHRSKQEAYDEGMRLLKEVGLTEKAYNYPDEMSGGQKQRAAIARTLALDPDVILLDEPTSALDPTMVGEVLAVIRKLARTGKTMMIVTHEMNFAQAIANRVFYLDEGGIYEEGTPQEIFVDPKREKTRQFIRKLKVLEIDITDKAFDFPGAQSEIEDFCVRNRISHRMTHHLLLAFEETAWHMLASRLEKPDIRCVIEYSEEKEIITFTLLYGTELYDLMQCGDQLSLSVIKSVAGDIVYEEAAEGTRKNKVRMTILP